LALSNQELSLNTASSSTTGALTNVDWNTFSNKQAGDATLTALAAHNANGLLTQTTANTFTGRTIMGTVNQVIVTNGDGVSGNPTVSLPQNIATTSTPIFAGVTLSGLNSAGVLHTNGSGVVSTSLIIDADITAGIISDEKLATITAAGKVANSATSATSINSVNTIVERDTFGNFSAGTIFADLTGDLTGNVTGSASLNVLKAGDTMSGLLLADGGVDVTITGGTAILNLGSDNADIVNLATATKGQIINIGTGGSGATTINIGSVGDSVNIQGVLTAINTINMEVFNKVITLNNGGLTSTGFDAGIEVEEAGIVAGYIMVT